MSDPARAIPWVPGERYRQLETLAAAPSSRVEKALDTMLDREIAVKCVRIDGGASGQSAEDARERFIREAQVAAKLQHPNIVTIHDIIATDDYGYIIMELVDGKSLESMLTDKGRLPLGRCARIVHHLAAALDYAHGRNIIHRDVKPANILVSADGRAWLTDFGLAKSELSTSLTVAGGVVGAPDYMSPEHAKGEDVEARSDLFSLGCVLFEAVVGEKPFRSASLTGVLLSIINDEPVFPLNWRSLGLPTELRPILYQSLEKQPEKRFASGAAMSQALTSLPAEVVAAADAAAPAWAFGELAPDDAAPGGPTDGEPPPSAPDPSSVDAVETGAESAAPAEPSHHPEAASSEPFDELEADLAGELDEAMSQEIRTETEEEPQAAETNAGVPDDAFLDASGSSEEPVVESATESAVESAVESSVEEPSPPPLPLEPSESDAIGSLLQDAESGDESAASEPSESPAEEASEPPAEQVVVEPQDPSPLAPEQIKALMEEQKTLSLSPALSARMQEFEISPEEGFLLSRIDGASRPADILAISPIDETETARALLDLLGKGLIQLDEQDSASSSGVPSGASAPSSPSSAPAPKPTPKGPDAAIVEEVDRLTALANKGDPAALLGVTVDTPASERKTAYLKLVARFHPDKFLNADDAFRRRLSDLCGFASDAADKLDTLAKEKAAAKPKATPAEPAPMPEEPPSAPFDKRSYGRELYSRALSAFERADFWEAVQLSRRAIEADDQDPEYHAILGRALMQNRKWRREAADKFLRASELQPANVDYIGTLAAIYRSEGLTTRANALLERARMLDPDYVLPELPVTPVAKS